MCETVRCEGLYNTDSLLIYSTESLGTLLSCVKCLENDVDGGVWKKERTVSLVFMYCCVAAEVNTYFPFQIVGASIVTIND